MNKLSLLISVMVLMMVSCSIRDDTAQSQSPSVTKQSTTDRYAVPVGESISIGPHDAPITIINFSDFQCPFSQRAVPVIALLMEQYPEKIRYVFKHFPLGFHRLATKAARTSIAADRQGNFWEAYELIFQNNKNLTSEKLSAMAQKLQLDMERFQVDSTSQESQHIINRDIDEGRQFGVRGTPTLFVNGKRMVGVEIKVMREIIAKDLKKAEKMKREGITDFYAAFIKNGMTTFAKPKSVAPPVQKTIYRLIPPENTPSIGNQESEMRIVAFLDYQCPHSRKVYNTMKELAEQKKRAVLLQFINLPLSFHLHAKEAALAALVANKHEKFELFSDKMFSTQHVWSSMDKSAFSDYLLSVAKSLEIDESTFKRELASATVKRKLRKQREIAENLGVHITPASFINGRYIRGAYPLFSFIATYDEEKQRSDLHRKEKSLSGEKLYLELVKDGEPFIHSASAQARRTLFADGGDIYTPRLHGEEPQIGTKSTPLTVVLFVDYPCPYSRRGFMLLKQLQSEQIEKLHVLLKHLPLRSSPYAREIALYAITVNSLYGEEKYSETAALLFSRQKEMGGLKKVDLFLKKLTEDLGLEWKKVAKKMHAPETLLILTKDIDEAQRLHVTGVPTLFINGKKIKGVHPISWFRAAINKRANEMKERPSGSSRK